MLDFKIPQIEDKTWVDKCFACAKSLSSEYTFGSVFVWKTPYRTQIARFKDFFICRWGKGEDISYSLPIGCGDFKEAVQEIIDDAKAKSIKPRIYGVTDEYRDMLSDCFPGKFSFKYDDGFNDYIYESVALAELSGKKYHGKRNHISNFKRTYPDWSYEEITEENIPECIELHTNWINNREDDDPDFSLEFEAVLTGFENYAALGLKGGLIRVGGKPVAYTFGEARNNECFVTHFEKAPSDINGAYTIINQEFAKRLLEDGYKYINREEDLGLEGLRKAKQSYHPAIWLKKEVAIYNE